jgi:hypothetical protein
MGAKTTPPSPFDGFFHPMGVILGPGGTRSDSNAPVNLGHAENGWPRGGHDMPFVDGDTGATNEGRRGRTDSGATPPLPFLIRIFGRTRQQSVGTSQRDGGFRRFALDRPLSRAALSARPSQVRGSRLRLCGVTTDAPPFPSCVRQRSSFQNIPLRRRVFLDYVEQ